MDVFAPAYVDAAVAYVAALIIKAEYVARLQCVKLHVYAVFGLGCRGAVQRVAELLVHIVHKAGAVKALLRAFRTVKVVVAYVLEGKFRNLLS